MILYIYRYTIVYIALFIHIWFVYTILYYHINIDTKCQLVSRYHNLVRETSHYWTIENKNQRFKNNWNIFLYTENGHWNE